MSSFPYAMRTTFSAALLVALTAAPSWTQGLPSASPESVGLSTERLERVDRVMKDYVDRGRVAGVVTLIARHGKVAHLQSYGRLDIEKNAPMKKDSIFRIASMSKAVTSIAATRTQKDAVMSGPPYTLRDRANADRPLCPQRRESGKTT